MRLKDEKFYKTVRDFLDIYLIRHRGYSLNTQKSYREAINLLLLYFKAERGLEYSNVGFEDITYSNITGFLEYIRLTRIKLSIYPFYDIITYIGCHNTFNPLSEMRQKEEKSMDRPHRLHPVGTTRSPQGRLRHPGVADRP